jgi:hypothetical protein
MPKHKTGEHFPETVGELLNILGEYNPADKIAVNIMGFAFPISVQRPGHNNWNEFPQHSTVLINSVHK